jgi:hypothetical protein
MTYQAQFFIAAIVGLTSGHLLFNATIYNLLLPALLAVPRRICYLLCCCRGRQRQKAGILTHSARGSSGGYGSTAMSVPLLSMDEQREAAATQGWQRGSQNRA